MREGMATGPGESKQPGAPQSRLELGRLIPLIAIGLFLVAFILFGGTEYLSFEALSGHREELMAWSAGHRLAAVLSFIAVYALLVAASVPGAVWMTIAGGFLFGTVEGALWAVIGATLGGIGLFLAARYALRHYFAGRAGPGLRRMEAGFRRNALSYLLFLRLVPLFPFWLVNLVPALLGVRLGVYVLGTFLGIIPGALVFASVGSGLGGIIAMGKAPDIGILFEPRFLGPLLGLAVLSLIPVLYKRGRKADS